MKSRGCVLFAVALSLSAGLVTSQAKAVDTKGKDLKATDDKSEEQKTPEGADYTIEIDGVSGKVSNPLYVVRPKDRVRVTVCPADWINYGYTIEKTEVKLQEAYPIVGGGTVFEGVSGKGTVPLGDTNPPKALEAVTDEGKKVLDGFISLRKRIGERRVEVTKAIEGVEKVAAGPLFVGDKGCQPWPSKLTDVAGDGEKDPPFFATHKAQADALMGLEGERQVLVARIRDIQLNNLLTGKSESNDFLDNLKADLESLQGEIVALQSGLDKVRALVDRWSKIMGHHPKPELSETFTMPQASTRFTIGVKRKPITPESLKELPEGTDKSKVEPDLIATTTFENRALHKFNISLGMVGALRDNSRDFEVAPSLEHDGSTVYHVRETKRDQVKLESAAFLGIYFKAVDNFKPNRGTAWMLMLGSEMSASPSDFFLGLGLDTSQGAVFGFGITEYEGVSPAKGWKVGQEVPTITTGTDAGKPRLATVPKEKKDALGAYLFLGFRPSIFKAFLDRRKP